MILDLLFERLADEDRQGDMSFRCDTSKTFEKLLRSHNGRTLHTGIMAETA